jgi:hypothetical protein
LVGKAVVNALAVHVHDGDHVGRVVADQVEEFFPFEQLAAYAMDQEILINSVEIEEENEADESSHGLGQNILGVIVLMKVRVRKEKGSQPESKKKRDDGRGCPEPPFPAFNSPEVCARVA